jgi:hypothetical protein
MSILVGVLMGLVAGMAVCARFLRQEIAANIGPKLRHIEQQLENLRSEIALEGATRLAALSERLEQQHPHRYGADPPD